MKRIVEFLLEQGGSILVEVDDSGPKPGPVRGPNSGEVVTKANQTFEAALERIKPAASAIITLLRDLTDSPDTVGVEFGIKLSAEAGAVLASAGVEANYKVTVTWKRVDKQDEAPRAPTEPSEGA
jgi:Trypsin-co-occurring domain 1